MINIANELITIFKRLHDKNGAEIVIDNKDELVMEIVAVIGDYIKQREEATYQGIKGIGDKIQETRIEITEKAGDSPVAEATVELDAVMESTEDATNKILDAAENIQSLVSNSADKELAEKITASVAAIFEACNFQDLTGQRIKKVMSTLQYIEKSVGGMLQSFVAEGGQKSDKRPDADLMNGPQATSDAPNQNDVDKLFDSA